MKKKSLFIYTLLLLQFSCGVQKKSSNAEANPVKSNQGVPAPNGGGNKLVKPTGLYVKRGNTGNLPDYVYASPDIDGVFLKYDWDKIQTGENKFDWSDFDSDFDKAIQHGKKIELCVVAGAFCPEWVYGKGVEKLHFIEATRNFYGKCEEYDVPVFWSEPFKTLWKNFIGSLAEHINSKPGYMDAITLVKLSGINSRSEETKLPQQMNVDKENCHTGDHRAIWAKAGFRPALVVSTWNEFADVIGEKFPNSYIGLAMVMPKTGFPDVDDDGKLSDHNNIHEKMLDAAIKKFPNRLAVNFTALKANGGTPPFIKEMHDKGVVTGYQLYGQFINPPCLKNNTCDDNELKDAFNNGFRNNADFIEVFFNTLKAYPGAIRYAKAEYKKVSK